MIQDVFIIGATGKVGSTLIDQIIKKRDTQPLFHVNPTRIVGLASSTHFVYSSTGIAPKDAYDFAGKKAESAQEYFNYRQLSQIAGDGHNGDESSLVFVDATAVNEPMTKFHLQLIKEKKHKIVTANKNPIALSDYKTFIELTENPGRYGYRCSVMAGADSVPFLMDLRDLNDAIFSINGCFSGTCGYICSELESGKKFSSIVRNAVREGYTEPHPRDDLSGLDVARKLIVLARTAGFPVGIEDVNVKPFVSNDYLSKGDVQDFLHDLPDLDDGFSERISHLKGKGLTLRYVAQMEVKDNIPLLEVSLKEVPKHSPLGGLEGTLNKIVIVSEAYPKGYVIEAPGAGLDVTARNIRRDLLHLLPERRMRF